MKTFYRNRLPHLTPLGGTFFVTFRLADALPQHVLRALKVEWDAKKEALKIKHKAQPQKLKKTLYEEQKRIFGKFDKQLDRQPYGSCILQEAQNAEIVIQHLKQYAEKYYELLAYCIMPNHVHFLADFSLQLEREKYVQLHQVLRKIKGVSAREINLRQGTTGKSIWAKESYDHYVRNDSERERIMRYILANPENAGLKAWPYIFPL